MTLENTERLVVFTGNGVATEWPFEFVVFAETDLQLQLVEGETTTDVDAADFSVNLTTGVVTYPLSGPPLTSAQKLVVKRVVSLLQPTSISKQTKFFADVVERSLDRLTMMAQQVQEEVRRSFRVRPTEKAQLKEILPQPNQALVFDGDGELVAGPLVSEIESANASAEAAEAFAISASVSAATATQAAADAADGLALGMPVGGVIQFHSPNTPAGYIATITDLGDGEGIVPMADYIELFAAIGFAGGTPGGMPLGTILNTNSDFTAGDFPPSSESIVPSGYSKTGLFFNGDTSGSAILKVNEASPNAIALPLDYGDNTTVRYCRLVVSSVTGPALTVFQLSVDSGGPIVPITSAGTYIVVIPVGSNTAALQMSTAAEGDTVVTITDFEIRTLGKFRLPARVADTIIRT